MTEIRVFPRRTEYTPSDELAFVGNPPKCLPTRKATVLVSVSLTWDRPEGRRLAHEWAKYYPDVQLGGPAFGSYAGPFVPGRFVTERYFFSSRGCIRKCPWCFVWQREGSLREIEPSSKHSYCLEDCNLLACSDEHVHRVFSGVIAAAKAHGAIPQMSAFDARIFNERHLLLCEAAGLEHVTFACDFPGADIHLRRIYPLLENKPKTWRECCVLCGYHGTYEDDIDQINKVIDCGFEPAVMLYQAHSDIFWHYSKRWLDLQKQYPRHPGDSVERQEPDGEIINLLDRYPKEAMTRPSPDQTGR